VRRHLDIAFRHGLSKRPSHQHSTSFFSFTSHQVRRRHRPASTPLPPLGSSSKPPPPAAPSKLCPPLEPLLWLSAGVLLCGMAAPASPSFPGGVVRDDWLRRARQGRGMEKGTCNKIRQGGFRGCSALTCLWWPAKQRTCGAGAGNRGDAQGSAPCCNRVVVRDHRYATTVAWESFALLHP
jgi:hypothetical protein